MIVTTVELNSKMPPFAPEKALENCEFCILRVFASVKVEEEEKDRTPPPRREVHVSKKQESRLSPTPSAERIAPPNPVFTNESEI